MYITVSGSVGRIVLLKIKIKLKKLKRYVVQINDANLNFFL